MKAFARKPSSKDTLVKRHSEIKNAPAPGITTTPVSSAGYTFLQPKLVCPCDGGCPSCLPIQTKLKVGQPNDKYEQEADRVAEQVMRMSEPACPECADVNKVQTEPSPGQSPQQGVVSQARLHAASCPGQPLTVSTRFFFEPRLGRDFSDVRVHTCNDAVQMCKELNAQAFTYGYNIYFNHGKYNPGTPSGNSLLSHELTHVVQQTTPGLSGGRAWVQRTIGDGHDLTNLRFRGEPRLEAAYDNELIIAVGSYGEAVRLIQEALLDLYFALPLHGADCEFGSETQRAIVDFQRTYEAKWVDGVVGPETMGLLDKVAPPGPPWSGSVCPTRPYSTEPPKPKPKSKPAGCTYEVGYLQTGKIDCDYGDPELCGAVVFYKLTDVRMTGATCPSTLEGLTLKENVSFSTSCPISPKEKEGQCIIGRQGYLPSCGDNVGICFNKLFLPVLPNWCYATIMQHFSVDGQPAGGREHRFTVHWEVDLGAPGGVRCETYYEMRPF